MTEKKTDPTLYKDVQITYDAVTNQWVYMKYRSLSIADIYRAIDIEKKKKKLINTKVLVLGNSIDKIPVAVIVDIELDSTTYYDNGIDCLIKYEDDDNEITRVSILKVIQDTPNNRVKLKLLSELKEKEALLSKELAKVRDNIHEIKFSNLLKL